MRFKNHHMPQIGAHPDSDEWPEMAAEYLGRFRAAYRNIRGHDFVASPSISQPEDTTTDGQRTRMYTLKDDMILLEWVLRLDKLISKRKCDYRGLAEKVTIIHTHLCEDGSSMM